MPRKKNLGSEFPIGCMVFAEKYYGHVLLIENFDWTS